MMMRLSDSTNGISTRLTLFGMVNPMVICPQDLSGSEKTATNNMIVIQRFIELQTITTYCSLKGKHNEFNQKDWKCPQG